MKRPSVAQARVLRVIANGGEIFVNSYSDTTWATSFSPPGWGVIQNRTLVGLLARKWIALQAHCVETYVITPAGREALASTHTPEPAVAPQDGDISPGKLS